MSAVATDSSKIPHSSFASRFGFGSSKLKHKSQIKTESSANTTSLLPESNLNNAGALLEINRNDAENRMVSSGNSSGHLIGTSDRSNSPAITVSSNASSVSPKENSKQGKISKGGLFGSTSKKDKKKQEKKEKLSESSKVSGSEKEPAHHRFGFSKLFGLGKHHQSSSSQPTPQQQPPKLDPETTMIPVTIATSSEPPSTVIVHSSTSFTHHQSPSHLPLLVTATSTATAISTGSSSTAQRPTYLPAMISADGFSNNMSPGMFSGMSVPTPLSPPDSSNSSSGLPQPLMTASLISSTNSYNARSTSALPATNPYVKPRAPTSSRPASPSAASPSFSLLPDLGKIGTPPTSASKQNQKEESPAANFIFRPRLAKPPLSHQTPTAVNSLCNSRLKSPTHLLQSQGLNSASKSNQEPQQTTELLTPSSVESLETRLLAKSLVQPSPPPPARKTSPATPKIPDQSSITIPVGKVTPNYSNTMATLLPRVAPLAKVDSLDTNLSISGFNTPAIEHVTLNQKNQQVLASNGEIDLKSVSIEKSAQMLDFARFLQNLADEQCLTSTCMRQSYSLDLRQIAISTSTGLPPPSLPRPVNPEPNNSVKASNTSCSPLQTQTPNSCMYCHHNRGDKEDSAPDSTVRIDPTMVQSTLTDVTFGTSELTLGSANDDATKITEDFAQEDGVSDGWTTSSLKSRPSQTSGGVNKSRTGVAKVSIAEPSAETKHSPDSQLPMTNSTVGSVVDAQCIEALSIDVASIKTLIEQLRPFIEQPQQFSEHVSEPVQTSDAMTATDDEPTKVTENPEAAIVRLQELKIAELEKELSNRLIVIETLQKLVLEQKQQLDARKEPPPPIPMSSVAINTESNVLKTETTQTDPDHSNEFVVTSSNGHIGFVPVPSPHPTTRPGSTSSVKSSAAASKSHIAKVHVVVTKPAVHGQSPVATLQVGESNSSTASTPTNSTASSIPGSTGRPTGLLRQQVSAGNLGGSGIVKPSPIYRKSASSALTSSASTNVSTGSHAGSPLASSTPSVVASSRLPRLTSPAHSTIPTPISVSGNGR